MTFPNGQDVSTELPIHASKPDPARRYDYWLGGKDNFAADRESGDLILSFSFAVSPPGPAVECRPRRRDGGGGIRIRDGAGAGGDGPWS